MTFDGNVVFDDYRVATETLNPPVRRADMAARPMSPDAPRIITFLIGEDMAVIKVKRFSQLRNELLSSLGDEKNSDYRNREMQSVLYASKILGCLESNHFHCYYDIP